MILQEINDKFQYTTDRAMFRFFDVWRIMSPEEMKGDCEDYALTVLWHLADKSPLKMAWWLLKRKAKIIFYKHRTRGTKHVGLQLDGVYVDNISRRWNDGCLLAARGYKKIITLPATFVALKLLVSLPFLLLKRGFA